ncbi:hypothetical protein BS17DRAFT_761849 [Gyrodon lividus]|nr:hypothetical protein BS17DRAFT_761849 [Gyrodon lividus]
MASERGKYTVDNSKFKLELEPLPCDKYLLHNMSGTCTLNCLVGPGDACRIFPIEISRTGSVTELKEAIKQNNSVFHDVDANLLDLYKVSFRVDDEHLNDKLTKLQLDDAESLCGGSKIFNIFSSLEDNENVHIIVKAPAFLPQSLAVNRDITLNCWVLGQDAGRLFSIEIPETKSIEHLQEVIKEKKSADVGHVDAKDLVLYKISLPDDERLGDELKKLRLHGVQPLRPMDKLSDVFSDPLREKHLHIAVDVPSSVSAHARLHAPLEGGNKGKQTDCSYGVYAEVTERSWKRDYVGEAANALWDYIWDHNFITSLPIQEKYIQYAAIVQSSGTGKSRVIDEMSKSRFVIPINLRDETIAGYRYPPRDVSVCSYFSVEEIITPREAYCRASAFLHALFETTKDVLLGDVPALKDLAKFDRTQPAPAQFRSHMEAGMSHEAHGQFRQKFYAVVCSRAFQLVNDYSTDLNIIEGYSRGGTRIWLMEYHYDTVLESLCKALGDFKASQLPADGPSKKKAKTAKSVAEAAHLDSRFVTVSFDDSHMLMQVRYCKPGIFFSVFDEIGRALRHLQNLPFFALFLTATGKRNVTTLPPPKKDSSSRIQYSEKILVPPFFDLGLDQVARKFGIHTGSVTLSSVSSEDQLCMYGRPLWGTRYEAGMQQIKDEIVSFAASKLLGGQDYKSEKEIESSSKLACLARRLPIEFLPTYKSLADDMNQVENHMRFILQVDENMENLVTVSPSEPILSEAAYWIMQNPQFNPPVALMEVLHKFSVCKGDRGELLVLLLFTMARDAAVGPADLLGRPIGGARTCLLTRLLHSLFYPPALSNGGDHVDVLKSPGHHVEPTRTVQFNELLETVFANSVVYFNHFIKIHQYKLVHINFLMCMMARGAAMLCPADQPGVDGLLPFLLDGDTIEPSNVGVILWKVENDSSFTDNPDLYLFDQMDPYKIGVFTSETKVPIIRIVFALGSKKPCLKAVKCMGAKKQPFVTYDFWVAGLDKDILVPIGEERSIWDALLQVSIWGWMDVYEGGGARTKALRQSVTPGAGVDEGYWGRWVE